jgi:basic membrane lipoprotein Med (substrate-binding protein (PBP1-ABC) superfamily)
MQKVTFLAALGVVCLGCSVIAKSDVEVSGIGALCSSNGECHAGSCDNGLCTATCSVDPDCPASTRCFAGKCQKPLKVAALWVGVVAGGEGWTLTHQEGMEEAASRLPYVSWYNRENILPFTDAISKSVDEAVLTEKADVIIANSFSQRDEILAKAEQYPNVKFITCSGHKTNGKNANSYSAREEQAWYVAGKVAGGKARKRIGYIGSFITPEVVRHLSAFFLGARSVNPAIEMEVQWIGFWFDYKSPQAYVYKGPLTNDVEEHVYREELLTYRLLEAGAEVIAHGADSQRSVRLVERLTKEGKISNRYTVSNDNRNAYRELTADRLPNGPPLQTCLGSPFWNWAPIYQEVFEEIHRGQWDPNFNRNLSMSTNPAESVPGFNLNPNVGIDDSAVRLYATDISQRGWEAVYFGPYATTGQRDADGDGVPDANQSFGANEMMSDREWQTMCWFPKGIVEKVDPRDPGSSDRDARVPDAARAADATFLADIEGPPGAPAGAGLNCHENL